MWGVDRTEGTLVGACALSGRCSVANGSGDIPESGGGLRYSGGGKPCCYECQESVPRVQGWGLQESCSSSLLSCGSTLI